MKTAWLALALIALGCEKSPDPQAPPPAEQPKPEQPKPQPEPEPEPEPTPAQEPGDVWMAFTREWDDHIAAHTGIAFGRESAQVTHELTSPFLTGPMREKADASLERARGLALPKDRPVHAVETTSPGDGVCTVTVSHSAGTDQNRLMVDMVRAADRWWIKTVRTEGDKTPALDLIALVLKLKLSDVVTAPEGHRWVESRSTPEQTAAAYAEMNVRVRVMHSDLWLEGTRHGIQMMKRYFAPEAVAEIEQRLAAAVAKGRERAKALACQKAPVVMDGDAKAYFMLSTPIGKDRMLLERVDLVKVGDQWLVGRVHEAAPCGFCKQTKLCPACKGTGEGKPTEACKLCQGDKRCIRCEGSGFAPRDE